MFSVETSPLTKINIENLLDALRWWHSREGADKVAEWGGDERTVLRKMAQEILHAALEDARINPLQFATAVTEGVYFECDPGGDKRKRLQPLYDAMLRARGP